MYLVSTNLKIQNCNPKSRFCLVAFSSHGKDIEQKFEFENLCKSSRIQRFYNKIIFLRDVNREFYINGIDSNISNISKILELLKSLTEGLTIRTVGCSSGGYMAILIALFLPNVDRAISMGGDN